MSRRAANPEVARSLRKAYQMLFAANGHQQWWPGETPFEVCVGAILTQNTAWSNVERAICNLKQKRVLTPRRMYALPHSELADLIRPAGYFNVKATRLRNFLQTLIVDYGASIKRLFVGETQAVRSRLLNINGIGPETADSMLLYAGEHASFVIDAYTKRIFQRHNWWHGNQGTKGNSRSEYDSLQALCEGSLNQTRESERLDYWQDFHAQLVMIGKDYCRPRNPDCKHCPLAPLLPKSG